MLTRFAEIGLTGRKTFKCACGRRLKRQRRFWRTLNPYNKDAAGNVKDQAMILSECLAQLDEWAGKPDPCTHRLAAAHDSGREG